MTITNNITEQYEHRSNPSECRVESLHGSARFQVDLTAPGDLKLLREWLDEDTFTNWIIDETNKLVDNAEVESVTWEVEPMHNGMVIVATPEDWQSSWQDDEDGEDWEDEAA